VRFMWGDYYAGECVHGERGVSCPTCHPQREDWDSPWALAFGVLLLIGFFLAAPGAIDRELANDEAQARRHRERIERMAPNTMATVAATRAGQ
jgi:hypothetical protein